MSRYKNVVLIGGAAVLLLIAGVLGTAHYVRRPHLTPAMRGQRVAAELGCFACHGPGGTGGVPNPGSDEEQIPAWDGGNAMMYVQNDQEIREWVLDGYPRRLAAKYRDSNDSRAAPDRNAEPGTATGRNSPPLVMPAYKSVISTQELEDLVAYYKAVAAFEALPPPARKGYAVALRLGCFGCHGPGGRVGVRNPSSFKGYIPPWRGDDFAELVENDDELRQWIREGNIDRFESNPLARYFTGRQIIKMPAYRNVIDENDLEALVAYIHWLRKEEP